MLNDYELRKLLLKTFKLTANEFVLYVTIREIYFYWGAEHGCYASNELLAEETNTSTGTIKRSLKVLQEKNLIQVCYAKDKGFLTKRNIYPLEDDLLRIKAEGILTERKSLQDSRNEVHADHNAVQDERGVLGGTTGLGESGALVLPWMRRKLGYWGLEALPSA